MPIDSGLFRSLVLDLWEHGNDEAASCSESAPNAVFRQCYNLTMTSEELEAGLRKDTYVSSPKCLTLPLESSREWCPFVWLDWDLTAYRARFQVALCSVKREASIGFRYESPEGVQGDRGKHAYHHAQLLRAVRGCRISVGVPEWVPESVPAFPIEAGSARELFLCLLLSLYGYGFQDSLVSEPRIKQELSAFFDGMRCVRRD